jgi:hypothetical protein
MIPLRRDPPRNHPRRRRLLARPRAEGQQASSSTGELRGVAALPRGTVSGKPTVTFRVDLPDGTVVLAETTLSLFLSAADAFKARHGDPLFAA